MNGFHLWVFGYLGLLQDRSRYMTPPPQVREQSDHSDQPDHWPCTALGPWSPNLTHCPLRHHCIMEKEKERILNTDQQCMKACFCIRFFFLYFSYCDFLAITTLYLTMLYYISHSCDYDYFSIIYIISQHVAWLICHNYLFYSFFFIHTEMCLHLKQPPKCVFVWLMRRTKLKKKTAYPG